jgi:hypothetical protein
MHVAEDEESGLSSLNAMGTKARKEDAMRLAVSDAAVAIDLD